MSWYRQGKASAIKGEKNITGYRTYWADSKHSINRGHIVLFPGAGTVQLYEIEDVLSDNSIVLTTSFTGDTVNQGDYAIINTLTSTVPDFAVRLAAQLKYYQKLFDNMDSWFSDAGKVSITLPSGEIVEVPSMVEFYQVVEDKMDREYIKIPDGTDLFTFFSEKNSGFYSSTMNVTNKPEGVNSWMVYRWAKYSDGYGILECIPGDGKNSTKIINLENKIWGVWKEGSGGGFEPTQGSSVISKFNIGESGYLTWEESAKVIASLGFTDASEVFKIKNSRGTNGTVDIESSKGLTVNGKEVALKEDLYDRDAIDSLFYNKTESDTKFLTKNDATNSFYNKSESDNKYADKSELKGIYTKQEIDNNFPQANTVYSKAQADVKFATKLDTYTKSESDSTFTTDSRVSENHFTKEETNSNFSKLGESYSKIESDLKYQELGVSYTKTESDNLYPKKEEVYSKVVADEKFALKGEGGTGGVIDAYTKTESDLRFANKEDTFTKDEVDERYQNHLNSFYFDKKQTGELLDKKLDLTGGTITKNSGALNLKNTSENQALFLGFVKADGVRRGFIGAPSDKDRISIVNDVAGTSLTLSEDKRLLWQGRDLAALNRVTGEARAAANWFAGQSGAGATFIKLCTIGVGENSSQSQRYQIFVTNTSSTGYSSSGAGSDSEQHFGIINLTIGNGRKPEKNVLGSYICTSHFDIASATISPVLIKQINAFKAEVWLRAAPYTNYTCLANTQGDMEISQHVTDASLVPVDDGAASSYYISNVSMFATVDKRGAMREVIKVKSSDDYARVNLIRADESYVSVQANPKNNSSFANIVNTVGGTNVAVVGVPNKSGTIALVGDSGVGGEAVQVPDGQSLFTFFGNNPSGFYRTGSNVSNKPSDYGWADFIWIKHSNGHGRLICLTNDNRTFEVRQSGGSFDVWKETVRVGDFGWGGRGEGVAYNWTTASITEHFRNNASTIWRTEAANDWTFRYCPNLMFKTGDTFANVGVDIYTGIVKTSAGITANTTTYKTNLLYGTSNTTVDTNGNIKKASPVIKVFKDHIETNDESEGVTLERVQKGRYKLVGTLGMNSDPSWGGIHGGMVVPNGINNLPLVWADYEVLENGDILIETRYRKHNIHPELNKKRLKIYPEFLGEDGVELPDYELCDIPNGHWIDIRVNMPEDSIYETKLKDLKKFQELEAIKAEEERVKELEEKARLEEEGRLQIEEEERLARELSQEDEISEESQVISN